jgi:hypothetical protein
MFLFLFFKFPKQQSIAQNNYVCVTLSSIQCTKLSSMGGGRGGGRGVFSILPYISFLLTYDIQCSPTATGHYSCGVKGE